MDNHSKQHHEGGNSKLKDHKASLARNAQAGKGELAQAAPRIRTECAQKTAAPLFRSAAG